jgi:hypothetical protein
MPTKPKNRSWMGMPRAFEAFGGVPKMIRYDNLKPAVIRIALGRERFEHPRFVAMRSHYGYDSFFCVPGIDGAHEKGGVEGEIGRFRRRHLTPMPHVGSLQALNVALAAADARDDARRIGGRPETVGEAASGQKPLDNLIWPHCAGLIWPHPGRLAGVGGSFPAVCCAVESVAAGAGLDDVGVEGEPIDHGCGEPGIGEGVAPFGEGRVGGAGDGGALLPCGDDLKQQFGTARVQG